MLWIGVMVGKVDHCCGLLVAVVVRWIPRVAGFVWWFCHGLLMELGCVALP